MGPPYTSLQIALSHVAVHMCVERCAWNHPGSVALGNEPHPRPAVSPGGFVSSLILKLTGSFLSCGHSPDESMKELFISMTVFLISGVSLHFVLSISISPFVLPIRSCILPTSALEPLLH